MFLDVDVGFYDAHRSEPGIADFHREIFLDIFADEYTVVLIVAGSLK